MYVYNDKAFSNAMKRTYTLRKTFMNSFQLLSWSHMRLRRVVINNCFKIEKKTLMDINSTLPYCYTMYILLESLPLEVVNK